MKPTRLSAVLLLLLALWPCGRLDAATLTVDDSGGADFTTITAAMNLASPGDVVYVFPGHYPEQVTLKDDVSLIGYGPHVTTIDGQGTAIHVVEYNGTAGALLAGFRIIGSGTSSAPGTWHYGGVYCGSGPLTVRNCIIEDCKAGVAVEAGANPTIINNTIVGNVNGIILGAHVAPPATETRVAVIYRSDEGSAKIYQELLADAGIPSDRIHIDDVAGTNFSAYDGIVVGTDTGGFGQWGTRAAVSAIAESRTPVLGYGAGGASLFEELGLSINWGNSAVATDNRILVVEPFDQVFNTPHDIPIPKSGILDLYNNVTSVVEVFKLHLGPSALPLGQDPVREYYPLVREGLYTLWGHEAPPRDLTETGRHLLINIVRRMVTRCYPDLPPPQIVATGMERVVPGTLTYKLRVTNWYMYPDDLFAASPDLPPCGGNTNASRTWVDIYAGDETHLYGFCAFDSASDLTELWFGVEEGEDPPAEVFVILHDRRCQWGYASNLVVPRIEPLYTHTIMNNIVVNNSRGIFYYDYLREGRILYNDVWGNYNGNYFNNNGGTSFVPWPGTGEISAEPLFVDTTDYYLGEGSPCRDAGHPGPAYFDPDGTRNDMGAYGGPEAGGRADHPGSGFIFTTIGNLPVSEIEQTPADPSHGLAVVDPCTAAALSIPAYHDAPFGATLRIRGLFGELDIANGVRYYQILLAPWDAPDDPPEPEDFAPMTSPLSKIQYLPQPDGTVITQLVNLGPKSIKGVDNLYQLTYTGWWSSMDLRILWHTRGFANGKYSLSFRAFRNHPILPTALQDYTPFMDRNELDTITMLVDNHPVDVNIHKVMYDPNTSPHWDPLTDGEIPECGIINLQNNTENLRFKITAYQAGGYMRHWILDALYGKNKYAGVIAQATYPGVVPPNNWPGVVEQEYDSQDGSLIPWKRCAYQFRLRAYTRATNGYGYLHSTAYKYSDTFSDHYFVDYGESCEWCSGADINKSGQVDWTDAALLFDKWLATCGPTCE